MNEPDDGRLVRDFLDGRSAAFCTLVERYQRPVFNIALRIVGDPEDARDVAQNAFVKACEKLGTFDHRFKFFSWLYRITINEALNFVDRKRPQRELGDDLVDAGRTPDVQYARDQLCLRVQAAVMRLPDAHREIVMLRHFADLSYAEMSNVLEIPEKTVKSRLFSARRSLREVLKPHRIEKT